MSVQEIIQSSPVQQEQCLAIYGEESLKKALANRAAILQAIASRFKAGEHFHVIEGRKSLSKGGGEELCTWLQLIASIEHDTETRDVCGKPDGWVFMICQLRHGSIVVASGRGSACGRHHANDWNKVSKMAQKSAFVDACLRAGGLSAVGFTQDIEDMTPPPTSVKASEHVGKNETEEPAARKPGRPPGSKNKPKEDLGKPTPIEPGQQKPGDISDGSQDMGGKAPLAGTVRPPDDKPAAPATSGSQKVWTKAQKIEIVDWCTKLGWGDAERRSAIMEMLKVPEGITWEAVKVSFTSEMAEQVIAQLRQRVGGKF